MTACFEVRLEQLFKQHGHVRIGSVNLVHHQEASGQQGMTHVGVAHFECTKQGLIDRTHGDGGGQKSLGIFSHPTLVGLGISGMVRPLNFKIRQANFQLIIGGFIAGQRTHHHGRIGRPEFFDHVENSLVQLRCCNARWQGKVQAVHLARLKQLYKTPERSFGFTAASFSLQHHGAFQRQVGCGHLHGARCGHAKCGAEGGWRAE